MLQNVHRKVILARFISSSVRVESRSHHMTAERQEHRRDYHWRPSCSSPWKPPMAVDASLYHFAPGYKQVTKKKKPLRPKQTCISLSIFLVLIIGAVTVTSFSLFLIKPFTSNAFMLLICICQPSNTCL